MTEGRPVRSKVGNYQNSRLGFVSLFICMFMHALPISSTLKILLCHLYHSKLILGFLAYNEICSWWILLLFFFSLTFFIISVKDDTLSSFSLIHFKETYKGKFFGILGTNNLKRMWFKIPGSIGEGGMLTLSDSLRIREIWSDALFPA